MAFQNFIFSMSDYSIHRTLTKLVGVLSPCRTGFSGLVGGLHFFPLI